MSEIIVEMLVRDQWLSSHFEEREKADTSFVYGTILQDFGYDRQDFNESVEFYVDHPEIFSKILEKSISLLEGRQLALENYIEQQKQFETDSLARIVFEEAVRNRLDQLPAPEWSLDDSLELLKPLPQPISFIYPEEERSRRSAHRDSLLLDSLQQVRHLEDSLHLLASDSLKIVVPYLRGHHPVDTLLKVKEDTVEQKN